MFPLPRELDAFPNAVSLQDSYGAAICFTAFPYLLLHPFYFVRVLIAMCETDKAIHTQMQPYHFSIVHLLEKIWCCDLFTPQLAITLFWWLQ